MSPGQVDPVIERDNPGGYSLACAGTLAAVTETAVAAESKITILYDAFGDDAGMKKDWSFSALVEVAGKRILFDTGNNRDIFAANVKAKNIDLTNLTATPRSRHSATGISMPASALHSRWDRARVPASDGATDRYWKTTI